MIYSFGSFIYLEAIFTQLNKVLKARYFSTTFSIIGLPVIESSP
jgi:hypothetical protein